MKRILVVIDMQEGAAKGKYHGRYLDQRWWERHAMVVARIKALSQKMETLFQVHTDFRRTQYLEVIPQLKDIAQKGLVVFKKQDDGSDVLATRLANDTHIYICGMNTDACILRTARGLKAKGYAVTVVGDACWTVYASESARSHHQALNALRRTGMNVIKTSAVR